MIFQHTWQQVVAGEKTQTRRPWNPSDYTWVCGRMPHNGYPEGSRQREVGIQIYSEIVRPSGTSRYRRGGWFCIQPGRTKPAIYQRKGVVILDPRDYVRDQWGETLDLSDAQTYLEERGGYRVYRVITQLWREDVRYIRDADVTAEGFAHRDDFLQLWQDMHDDYYMAAVVMFKRAP